jgi:hypothetical protein
MIKGMVLYKKSSGTKLLYSSTKDNVIYGVVQEVSGKTYPEKSVQAIISKGYWDAVYLTNDDVEKHQQHDQSSHGNWAGKGGASKIVNNLQLWNESELSKFSSSQEHQNYLNEKMLSQVENGFQADSFKKVVRTYQGAYGREINEALRDPLISEEQWQDDIDGLDNAIKAAPGVSEPTIVYRGIRGNGLDFFNSLKSGDVFQDKGFISTTLDTQVAFDFASAGNLYEGIVMKIKLPIGSKGLFPAGVTGLDFAGYESEFILPRDSKLKIVNNKGKVWDVEVVND